MPYIVTQKLEKSQSEPLTDPLWLFTITHFLMKTVQVMLVSFPLRFTLAGILRPRDLCGAFSTVSHRNQCKVLSYHPDSGVLKDDLVTSAIPSRNSEPTSSIKK